MKKGKLKLLADNYYHKKLEQDKLKIEKVIEGVKPFLNDIERNMEIVALEGEYSYEFRLPEDYNQYYSEIEYYFKKNGFEVETDIESFEERGAFHMLMRCIQVINMKINWDEDGKGCSPNDLKEKLIEWYKNCSGQCSAYETCPLERVCGDLVDIIEEINTH